MKVPTLRELEQMVVQQAQRTSLERRAQVDLRSPFLRRADELDRAFTQITDAQRDKELVRGRRSEAPIVE